MKNAKGFTLIELVIVIVILGILGAVAAPKLFNLQGDAYGANLNAMKSSISTSMTMANAKAQIQGQLNATGQAGDFATATPTVGSIKGYEGIKFVNGYPAASTVTKADQAAPAGILATLENFDAARYDVSTPTGTPLSMKITPKSATDKSKCLITYTEAVAASEGVLATPAEVKVDTSGC